MWLRYLISSNAKVCFKCAFGILHDRSTAPHCGRLPVSVNEGSLVWRCSTKRCRLDIIRIIANCTVLEYCSVRYCSSVINLMNLHTLTLLEGESMFCIRKRSCKALRSPMTIARNAMCLFAILQKPDEGSRVSSLGGQNYMLTDYRISWPQLEERLHDARRLGFDDFGRN